MVISMEKCYPLVICYIAMDGKWQPWPIEIDGLPIKNGESFHGKLLNNQRVICYSILTQDSFPHLAAAVSCWHVGASAASIEIQCL